MRSYARNIVMLAGVLALAACGESEPAAGDGATIVENSASSAAEEGAVDEAAVEETSAAEAETETEPEAEVEVGTRDNPVELGTTIDLGDWEVTINEVVTDATEQVLAENQFNDPPAEGRQFVIWSVDATYNGDDSGTAWLDLSWGFVGNEGNTFKSGDQDYCGSIPSDLNDTGETFPGGNVSGNKCASVVSDQIEGGTIFVENSLSFDSDRVFFAVS